VPPIENIGITSMGKKAAVFVGSLFVMIALGAAATPPLAVNYSMQQLANEKHDGESLEETLNKFIEADPEFVAIIPRLELTDTWVAVDSAGAFEKTFDGYPKPMRDIYQNLPGVQSLIIHLKEHDAEDARIIESKGHAKVRANLEARNICRVVKGSTPYQIAANDTEKISLTNPENLSAYLDYCGGNAASYKEALSKVVVQLDIEAERAETKKRNANNPH
jgi:hypothetical protein